MKAPFIVLLNLLLFLKESNAGSTYSIATSNLASCGGSSRITASSVGVDCGNSDGVCNVGDTVTLNAKGKIIW